MKTPRPKVTLKDVADYSGFSISTVSRALARNGMINEDTEKRIIDIAKDLNYPLKENTIPLDERKCIFIAIITQFHVGEFYSVFYDGFDNATKGTNINLVLVNVKNSSLDEASMIKELSSAHYEGAIIFFPDFNQQDYQNLIDKTDPYFPIISVAPIANPIMDTITFDTYRGGHLIADHFHKQGFKRLGILHGPQNKSEAMLRKNGFIDFVNLKNELNLIWQFEGNYEQDSGIEAYLNFKDLQEKPDAIFCSNDSMAVGFINAALADGTRIPEDVAIAGYDDLPICEFQSPNITSVHTPFEMLGRKAVEYLVNRISTNKKNEHSGYVNLVPVTVRERESTKNLNRND